MKSFLTILLMAGIITSAGISLLVMDHHSNCIASAAAGVSCPEQLNSLAFFGIHLNFLRNFSEGLLTSLIAILLLASVYAFSFTKFLCINPAISNFFKAAFPDLNPVSLKRKLISWLSLRENSPVVS